MLPFVLPFVYILKSTKKETKMEVENSEKIKKDRKGPIKSLTLNDIPRSVHKFIGGYQTKLIGDRRKKYTIKQAYVEYLKEVTKTAVI